MPVARARSFFGNHSATVFIEAGKLPASPRPSRNLTMMNPRTETNAVEVEMYQNQLRTTAAAVPIGTIHAWAMAARLHNVIE